MQRRRGSENMSESRKNKSIKRSRVAAARIMRSAAEATVEPLEQRQLLTSVGISFTGGYSGGTSVPPWSVGTTALAGIQSGIASAALNQHSISGSQQNWNDENGGSGSQTGLLDSTGTSLSNLSVTWSGGGTWSSAVNQPAQGDERLMTGFLNSGGTATPVSVTVSNVPYAQYDVVVYMLNDAAGRVQTTTVNGYSLYGSSPNPITNAFAPQYLVDSNPATPFYYAQGTSANSGSPSSNIDYEVFSMQGTGAAGSSVVINDASPGNGYVNAIQIVDDETHMTPFAPVENTTISTISSVILNWQAVMGNVTYTVVRSNLDGTGQVNIGTTAAGTTTFTDTTAVAGTTYNYWVTATSPLGLVSAISNKQPGHIDPFASPPAPTNLTAVANPGATPPNITLNWTASPNTTGYVIQRSTDYGSTWQTINPNGNQVTGTSFVDSTVTGGPAYLYRVGSINDASNQQDLTNSSGNGTVNFSNTAGDGFNIQGTGDGLSGYYFNSINGGSENQTPFTGIPFGNTVNPGGVFFSRVEQVDYRGPNADNIAPPNSPSDWKSTSNVGDNFTVDWAGQVQPTATGSWTFYSGSDDGIEVDIQDLNGTWYQVDNNIRTYRGFTFDQRTVPFQMIAGQKYNINVAFHEGGGGWGWELDWSGPGVPSQTLVPNSALYSVPLDGSIPFGGNSANAPLPTNVAIPKMVIAAGGDSTASLTWHTLAADGYVVWRATENPNGSNTAPPISAFSPITTLAGTGTSSYVDTTVTNGTDYWYFVTGYTQYGTGPLLMGPSPTQGSLTQAANQALVGTRAPLAFTVNGNPTLPAESQVGYQPVSLTWGSAVLGVEYHVYRNTTASTVGAVELTNANAQPISPTTGTGITDSTAQIGHSYYYYVVAQNAFGTTTATNSTNSSTPFVLVDMTHGLKASYYNDQWWHSLSHGINNSAPNDPLAVFGTSIGTFGPGRGITITGGPTPGMASVWSPEAVNFVPNLNINYNGASPVNGIRSTYFSTVYSGQISLTSGVSYTFFTNSDDDSFVFVNGQIAAEDPYGHGFNGDFNTSNLLGTNQSTTVIVPTATQNYPFFAAYSQGNGGSGIFVKWSTNGSAPALIPQSAFTSSVMPTPETPDSGMALFRTYNNGQDATITGNLGQTPKVTFTFTNDNIHNAISMILERAEVDPSTGVTSGDWMMVADAPVPNINSTGTVIDTSALASKTYSYRLVAANFDGIGAAGPALIKDPTIPNDPGNTQIAMPAPTANGLTDIGYAITPGGENQGVEGHFYNDQFWGDPNQRNASTSSINDITNFGPTMFGTEGEWAFNNIAQAGDENHPFPSGNTGPSAASKLQIDGRNSSVVFTGKVQINTPGTYTFYSNTDDDGYLFVNGQLTSADGGGHGTRNPATVLPIVITQADINSAKTNPMNIQTWSGQSLPLFNFQFFEAEGGGGWGTFMYEAGPDTGGVLKLVNTGQLYSQSDPLTAPTINGTASVSNNNAISFNFTDTNTDELRYVLERSTSPTFTDATSTVLVNEVGIMSVPTSHAAGTWTGTTTTIADNAIPAGQTFYYRIRAENYDFVSPWAVVGGSTPTAFTTGNSMPAPTGVSILQDGNQVHVSWSNHNSPGSGINVTKSSGGTGYDVQRQVVGQTTWTDLATLPPNASAYFDNINGGAGVTTPTAYVYRVENLGQGSVPASAFVNSGTLTMQPSPTTVNIPTGGFGAVSGNFGYGSSGSGSYTTKISPEGYLQLTDGNNNESRSAFLANGLQVNTSNGFKTTFDFTFTSGFTADGMTFLMQPNSNNAQGGTGGGFGASINPSVGVYFNLWNNVSQTGIEFNGNRLQTITVPGNPFHSTNPSDTSRTDPMNVVLTYNGYKLTETITDTVTNSTFTQVYTPVPIFGSMLHDNNVFVGFTAGTGGVNMTSQIRDWSFTPNNLPAVQISGTTGNDTLTIKRDSTNVNQVDYWLNVPTTGPATGNLPLGTPYNITLLGGNDVLNLDNSLTNVIAGGSTLASVSGGTITENVIGGTGNDTVNLDGANNQVTFNGSSLPLTSGTGTLSALTYTDGGGNDNITTTGTQAKTVTATTGNDTITKNGTGALTLNPGTGKLALNAAAGATTIPTATSGGIRHVAFSNITIGATASVALANTGALGDYSNHANRTLAIVDAGGLNIAAGGTLDMGDNSMLLKYLAANKTATDTMMNSLLSSGFAGQAWNGTGINSSEASNDAFNGAAARAVGWADQFDVGVNSFEGDSADVADGNEVMVKFTYYGDTDLDGRVASSDSSNFSTGVHITGNAYWEFGDFDYSGGKPTASDSQLFSTGLAAYKTFGQL